MFVAGLLQYLPCLLGPQHEIQVAHGDVNGFGEFFHLCLGGEVLSFGQGVGNTVYYPEPFQVLEYVPVENGQVLVEADVSQEVAGLFVADAFNVPDEPLPCLMATIDLAYRRSEGNRVAVQELVPGLHDIGGFLVDESGADQLSCDLGTISPKEHPCSFHVLHGNTAHRAPGHGREDAKGELAEDLLFRTCVPNLLKLV